MTVEKWAHISRASIVGFQKELPPPTPTIHGTSVLKSNASYTSALSLVTSTNNVPFSHLRLTTKHLATRSFWGLSSSTQSYISGHRKHAGTFECPSKAIKRTVGKTASSGGRRNQLQSSPISQLSGPAIAGPACLRPSSSSVSWLLSKT